MPAAVVERPRFSAPPIIGGTAAALVGCLSSALRAAVALATGSGRPAAGVAPSPLAGPGRSTMRS